MSEFSTPEERTEMPTDRRMQQLRRDGSLFQSHDVTQTLSLIAGFVVLTMVWGRLFTDMKLTLVKAFEMTSLREQLSVTVLYRGFLGLLYLVLPDVLIIVVVVAAVASLSVMLQTNWNIKQKKIEFKFNMINPMAGLKRIFSVHGFVGFLKALVKLVLILPIPYHGLKYFAPQMLNLMHMSIEQTLTFTGVAMGTLFWKVLYVLIALSIFDYAWGKFQWLKVNKMTKAEVKDERKAVEGDEDTKRKIINKGLQRIMQRIRDAVPRADVVVTNPTHFAVALQYDRKTMKAPTVVAKGKGFLALRIRAIARENNVPVLERKMLARSLFASTEVGAEIPYELFKAVAEVLAYVYKLKSPYGSQANPTTSGIRQ